MKNIFISYSHVDEKWKNRVKKHLDVLQIQNIFRTWDDRLITFGKNLMNEIEEKLNVADAYILLVSADFLTSKFILQYEIPVLLKRNKIENIAVFPVILSDCAWEEVEWLKIMRIFPDDGIPIEGMKKKLIEKHLKLLALEVKDAIFKTESGRKLILAPELSIEPESKTIFLTDLPKCKIKLLGRERELKEMEEKLDRSQRLFLVNGIGGIGKTEVCKRFFRDHYYKFAYAAWIDYTGSFKTSIINAIKTETIGGEKNDTLDQRFERIIQKLKNLRKEMLLVLDNVSNGLEDDSDLELLFLLPKNIHIIATSRLNINEFDIYPLDVLPEDACMSLFYTFYKGKSDDISVKIIIQLCGFHTLIIELLARTAQNSMKSAKELLKLLRIRGFNLGDIIKEKIGTFYNDEQRQRVFLEHLLTLFDLFSVTEKETLVLANLSVLPAVNIAINVLKKWLGLDSLDEINGLIRKGWLKSDTKFNIYLHPVMGEAVRLQKKIDSATCSSLISSLTQSLSVKPGKNPIEKRQFVIFGESVVRNIFDETELLASLANNLSLRILDMGELNRALVFGLKALKIRKRILKCNHPDLAISYNNISMIYFDLGRFKTALKFGLNAISIKEKIFNVDNTDLAISYNNLSLIYRNMGILDQALEFGLKDLAISEKKLKQDHPNLAVTYNNLSLIYKNMGQLERALEFQLKDVFISEKTLKNNHPDLATSYNNLSLIYQKKNELSLALKFGLKAFNIRKKILGENHADYARSCHTLSLVYKDLGKLSEALNFQRKALNIMENVLPKGHPDIKLYKETLKKIESLSLLSKTRKN